MDNEMQQTNPDWYKKLQYQDVKIYIKDNINSASRSFVAIGYYLKYVRDNELFSEDGYNTIWEFAQGEFGIGKSSASRFMAINDRFSKDGNTPILLEQYKDFSSSKLSEMLTMSDEQLDRVSITTTRAEIREMKQPAKEEVVAPAQQEPECFIRNGLTDGVMCSGGISEECNICDKYEPVDQESTTIDDLDLSVRTYNCLKRAGIDTIDELCELTRDDVIGIRNISHKCLDEIYMKLSGIGRCLKEEIRNESIDSEPEDNDDNIPDPDLSCKFDPDAKCLTASKESCKRINDDRCMYSSGWDEEDYIIAELDVELDPIETVEADIIQTEQPELPILKNNDQRKEFIEVYKTWPVWIDQELTGERYYRYDFDNGESFVIRVSLCRKYLGWDKGYSKELAYGREEYFILKKDLPFVESGASKSMMIDYLKDFQKKGG